jgi:hypothetical protein
MDAQDLTPVAAGGKDRYKPLDEDLDVRVREFTEALRVCFQGCGLSLRQFGARYFHDHTTVWRYLNGDHVPERGFVDDVIKALEVQSGSTATAETRTHLYELHLAALEATSAPRHRVEILTAELREQVLRLEQAQRQIQSLSDVVADKKEREDALQARIRELETAADREQIRHGAELNALHAENQRLHEELTRLEAEVEVLGQLLEQARGRSLDAQYESGRIEHELCEAERELPQLTAGEPEAPVTQDASDNDQGRRSDDAQPAGDDPESDAPYDQIIFEGVLVPRAERLPETSETTVSWSAPVRVSRHLTKDDGSPVTVPFWAAAAVVAAGAVFAPSLLLRAVRLRIFL